MRPIEYKENGKKRPDPIDISIGNNLRILRLSKGMSLEKLAYKLGNTYQQISKYQAGTNRLSGSMIVKIARVLDVHPAFFFDEVVDGPISDAFSGIRTTGDMRIIAIYGAIKCRKKREAILKLMQTMAGGDAE